MNLRETRKNQWRHFARVLAVATIFTLLATVAQAASYRLTTNVVGSGTVTRSPNATRYNSGTVVTLTANPAAGYTFSGWSGALSGTANPTTIVMNSNKTVTATFVAIVSGDPYTFPTYTAPEVTTNQVYLDSPSLTVRNDWSGVNRTITNKYLAFRMGPTPPAVLTDAIINSTLTRINTDLKYIVEQLRMNNHPSTSSQYLNYYLLDSGIPGDTSTPGAETGYQGWREYPIGGGNWYPDVETTHHALTINDDYHRWSLTHEFVHILQHNVCQGRESFDNDFGGWFHEAHNNMIMAKLRYGLTGVRELGWLDPYTLMGSYLPIESFGMKSGGGAAGPGEWGVISGGYGGYRYSVMFPLFLSLRVKPFFTQYLWQNTASAQETVMGAITRILGSTQAKQVLMEYGARNAILDYGEWTDAVKTQLNNQWNDSTGNWFYTATTTQSGWLTPSDTVRLPRHEGRNNIPITVNSGATSVTVEFSPNATGSNGSASDLRAQLVYRSTNGSAVFSQPVSSGPVSLNLASTPANGVVFLVITNVKLSGYSNPQAYGWNPNETFGYKFRILAGGTPAPTNVKYF